MQDLGTLSGDSSEALDINNSGQVVGHSSSSYGTRAFLWTSSGGIQDLNDLIHIHPNFELLEALSINDLGLIVAIGKDVNKQAAHDHNPKHDNHQGPISLFLLIPRGS